MRNLTITAEDEVVRWVKIRAAESDESVSRFVGRLLKEQMLGSPTYEEAMKDFLSRDVSKEIRGKGHRLPKRSELYDRLVLRRH
jgi:hypothetical protein